MAVGDGGGKGVGEAHGEGERETEREGKRERERETETERETERQREPRGTSKSIENLANIYRFENELEVNRTSTGKSYCRRKNSSESSCQQNRLCSKTCFI